VGINLVRYLLETHKYKITVLDNLSIGNYQLLKQTIAEVGGELENGSSDPVKKVCFYKMDILDKMDMIRVIKDHDLVVHLAAQTGVISSQKDPFQDASSNIIGTLNLLDGSVKNNVQKFIFASSAAPLGEQKPPMDERKIPRPRAPYGASKLAGEAYCSAFYHSYGLNTVVLRFSNVYGPHSFHKGSVVAQFIKRILKNEPVTVYGDGEQTRDFLYVEDITRVIHELLQTQRKRMSGEFFQLGTGVETSVNRLISYLTDITGLNIDVVYKPERKGEIKQNFASIKKINKRLGYTSEFELKIGLAKTWEWFKRSKEIRERVDEGSDINPKSYDF
jgi:UDP-glucose 4-epimerase